MIEKLTIGQYAKRIGVQRDTVYKRLNRDGKLINVTKISEVAGIKIVHYKATKPKLTRTG